MKRSILLALLLACGTAKASDWESVAVSTDGTEVLFVDVSSIRVASKIRRAWDKVIPIRHSMKGYGTNDHKWISYELGRVAFNCDEETVSDEGSIVYYEDGSTSSSPPETPRPSWKPVPPDSLQSFEMQFICTWKPK